MDAAARSAARSAAWALAELLGPDSETLAPADLAAVRTELSALAACLGIELAPSARACEHAPACGRPAMPGTLWCLPCLEGHAETLGYCSPCGLGVGEA